MTRIRQVAPPLHIINFNNLCFRVENETTLSCAKNRVDLSSISEVRSYITEWPRFFGPPCILYFLRHPVINILLCLPKGKLPVRFYLSLSVIICLSRTDS